MSANINEDFIVNLLKNHMQDMGVRPSQVLTEYEKDNEHVHFSLYPKREWNYQQGDNEYQHENSGGAFSYPEYEILPNSRVFDEIPSYYENRNYINLNNYRKSSDNSIDVNVGTLESEINDIVNSIKE